MRGKGLTNANRRLAERLLMGAAALALGSALSVVLAVTMPIGRGGQVETMQPAGSIDRLPTTRPALQPLLAKLGGSTLIRPAQMQAAVKNDGSAERLLKKLKLQGVVQMGEDLVAYIQVEKEGTKTLRKGQTVLDFVVEHIEGGKVTLSLQGVVVSLAH